MSGSLDPRVSELAREELNKLFPSEIEDDSDFLETIGQRLQITELVSLFLHPPQLSLWQQLQIKLGLTTYNALYTEHSKQLAQVLKDYPSFIQEKVTEIVANVRQRYEDENQ